jgi:hypothetical protein
VANSAVQPGLYILLKGCHKACIALELTTSLGQSVESKDFVDRGERSAWKPVERKSPFVARSWQQVFADRQCPGKDDISRDGGLARVGLNRPKQSRELLLENSSARSGLSHQDHRASLRVHKVYRCGRQALPRYALVRTEYCDRGR